MGFGMMDGGWDIDPLEYKNENYELWRCRDGTTVEVTAMETSHIRNVVAMILEDRFNREWIESYGDIWLEVLEAELERRHE